MNLVIQYSFKNGDSGKVSIAIPDVDLDADTYVDMLKEFIANVDKVNSNLIRSGATTRRKIER